MGTPGNCSVDPKGSTEHTLGTTDLENADKFCFTEQSVRHSVTSFLLPKAPAAVAPAIDSHCCIARPIILPTLTLLQGQ